MSAVELDRLPAAYGDKRLITQVFQNLLANAIKFTRNRSVTTIEVGYQAGAGEDVYFVRDNGVGFDMNHARKLFGTFQRLHAANEFARQGLVSGGVANLNERLQLPVVRCLCVVAQRRLDGDCWFAFVALRAEAWSTPTRPRSALRQSG